MTDQPLDEMAHGRGDDTSNQFLINKELKKECDFYFSKLCDIEVLCQESEEIEEMPIIQKIVRILYATDDGFLPPTATSEHEKEN
ncbi:microtubule-associated protein RP/EB family member 1-like [Drosophila serrata]|uniref:microtubule-associated protein RP/EB family member 1-like n=1 Tax=Drosophila serrata TaxID=7274 RepID=UPI000A1D322C|nr:microtubule-associated protein RP/EB family member 1-like [Drosophila serrata]